MNETIEGEEIPDRPSDGAARLSGAQAVAASASVLFAVVAGTLLSLNGAPLAAIIVVTLSAAPMAGAAAAAIGGAAPARTLALTAIPIALAATWTAWVTSGVTSPAFAWIFAPCAVAGLFAGPRGAIVAGLLAIGLGALVVFAPDPPATYAAHMLREDRALIMLLSWGAAMVAVTAGIWAALSSWTSALPPLRHPTIQARRALGQLAEDAASCALRIGADGRVVQALGAVERTLDLPREEVKGAALSVLLHPDDAAATAAHLTAAQSAAEAPKRRAKDAPPPAAFEPLTLRVRSRLGGYRWLEASFTAAAAFPTPAGHEASREAMLVLRERWRPLQEDLAPEDAERSAFLAQMSAALRDELTEVVGYAEIMKGELFGPLGGERYREYARLAHDSGARMLERIEELLDLAGLEAGGKLRANEIVDTAPVIDGAVRLVRSQAELAGVAVSADIPADAPHVRIDRRALRRVLVTLLSDAVKRTAMGDAVRLKVSVDADAMQFVTLAERRDHAVGAPAALEGPGEGEGDGAPEEAEVAAALRAETEIRFGRIVARSLVERLGGVISFTDFDGRARSAASGAGAAQLAEAILPLEPPSAVEESGARPQPIAAPRARAARPASAPPDRARRGRRRRFGGAAVVAAPIYDEDEETAEPLTAEQQTERARRFEKDLRQTGSAAKKPGADEDEVDRPLFAPEKD